MRVIVWGIPAAIIFAAVTLGDRKERKGPIASALTLMGNASYSMYLLHPIIGSGVILIGLQLLAKATGVRSEFREYGITRLVSPPSMGPTVSSAQISVRARTRFLRLARSHRRG